MSRGLPGADSSQPVTAQMIQNATALFGAKPCFWGRYFTSLATAGTVEYQYATENAVLHAAGIPLLPVARQTSRVGSTQAQGNADGQENARDFITTFGLSMLVKQGGIFYMFLDVEGSPSLSADYYTGWVAGMAAASASLSRGAVRILPCVYGAQGNTASWIALKAAMSNGALCEGAWIARYHSGQCQMGDWELPIVTPSSPTPFPCPIFAWQYAANCNNGAIDATQTNPALDIAGVLLKYLVYPPA